MTILRSTLVLVTALALAACAATGPKYAEVKASIPAVAKDKGRVYFYRSEKFLGGGIRPSVMLDGQKVGESTPGGFFYVDVRPGNHTVSLTSEVEKKLTFTINKAESRYVKLSVGLGVLVYRVYPELVDPKQGEADLADLSYIGPALAQK